MSDDDTLMRYAIEVAELKDQLKERDREKRILNQQLRAAITAAHIPPQTSAGLPAVPLVFPSSQSIDAETPASVSKSTDTPVGPPDLSASSDHLPAEALIPNCTRNIFALPVNNVDQGSRALLTATGGEQARGIFGQVSMDDHSSLRGGVLFDSDDDSSSSSDDSVKYSAPYEPHSFAPACLPIAAPHRDAHPQSIERTLSDYSRPDIARNAFATGTLSSDQGAPDRMGSSSVPYPWTPDTPYQPTPTVVQRWDAYRRTGAYVPSTSITTNVEGSRECSGSDDPHTPARIVNVSSVDESDPVDSDISRHLDTVDDTVSHSIAQSCRNEIGQISPYSAHSVEPHLAGTMDATYPSTVSVLSLETRSAVATLDNRDPGQIFKLSSQTLPRDVGDLSDAPQASPRFSPKSSAFIKGDDFDEHPHLPAESTTPLKIAIARLESRSKRTGSEDSGLESGVIQHGCPAKKASILIDDSEHDKSDHEDPFGLDSDSDDAFTIGPGVICQIVDIDSRLHGLSIGGASPAPSASTRSGSDMELEEISSGGILFDGEQTDEDVADQSGQQNQYTGGVAEDGGYSSGSEDDDQSTSLIVSDRTPIRRRPARSSSSSSAEDPFDLDTPHRLAVGRAFTATFWDVSSDEESEGDENE